MPIKPIAYSSIENTYPQTIKPITNEADGRVALLINELCRFFKTTPSPITFIATKEETLFLVRQTHEEAFDDIDSHESLFIKVWSNLMVDFLGYDPQKNERQLLGLLNRYNNHPSEAHRMRFNLMLLRIILTPRATFLSFIDACLSRDKQSGCIVRLVRRQDQLIQYLANQPEFKTLFSSIIAANEATKYHNATNTFQICNERVPMDEFTSEAIHELFLDQQLMLVEELKQDMFIPSELIAFGPITESPNDITTSHTPSPPPRHINPSYNGSFFSNAFKTLRGSPYPVAITTEDSTFNVIQSSNEL
jgi:hypothetical protein